MDFGDVFIPWKEGQEKPIQRYIHAFRKRELIKLAKKAKLKVKECKYMKRNNKNTNLIIVVENNII